jgi:hypothetical protein
VAGPGTLIPSFANIAAAVSDACCGRPAAIADVARQSAANPATATAEVRRRVDSITIISNLQDE